MASHTACAVLRSALLRNCATVLNRDTRVNAHIKARTVSRDTGASCCSGGAAAASTGMNEAKRAGSSEAPKSAGRDVGWIVCQPAMQKQKGQRIETESSRASDEWRVRTFSRAQRAAVSAAGMRSHERVNSKSVRGVAAAAAAAAAADIGAARADAGAGSGARAGVGGTGDAGAGSSRDLDTVSLPDMWKMPPPTRPTDFTSRACFASLKDDGGSVGFCADAGAGAAGVDLASGGVDAEDDSVRELMGFRRSPSVRRGVLVDVEDGGCDCGVSLSTMVIGMRRRFGGAVDAAGKGVET